MVPEILIRRLEGKDFSEVFKVIKKALEPLLHEEKLSESVIYSILEKYEGPKFQSKIMAGEFYVAQFHDKVVGIAGLISDIEDLIDLNKISTVFVQPNYQGKGIGKLLLNNLIEAAKKRGIKILMVNSRENAETFYSQFGFVRKAIIKTVHEDGMTSKVIRMEKLL